MELGLDPDLGEGGEEERILGSTLEVEGDAPTAGKSQGGGKESGSTAAASFKDLHRRLTEINQQEAEEDGNVDGKVK